MPVFSLRFQVHLRVPSPNSATPIDFSTLKAPTPNDGVEKKKVDEQKKEAQADKETPKEAPIEAPKEAVKGKEAVRTEEAALEEEKKPEAPPSASSRASSEARSIDSEDSKHAKKKFGVVSKPMHVKPGFGAIGRKSSTSPSSSKQASPEPMSLGGESTEDASVSPKEKSPSSRSQSPEEGRAAATSATAAL